MTTISDLRISRRSFLASASAATTVALLAPRKLFAQDEGLVQTARKTAAAATVTVQKIRGNISVLMGAGGNIAVLPGRDGKLLIDAGFAGAHPEGRFLVDTGDTARNSVPGYLPWWSPFFTKEVVIKVAPFEEIGFRLQEMGLDPVRHIAAVILTHFHHDHTGGLDHFPHTRIIAPRESRNVSRGFQGKMAGCLPQRWPIWLKPELVDIDGPAVGPFPHSHPITKDGRIFLVATPGHSKGHVSVVARGEGVSYFWQATPHMMKPVCEMNSRMGLPTNRHSP